MTSLVNLTPHELVVYQPDRAPSCWPPSGTVARLTERAGDEAQITVEGRTLRTVALTYDPDVVGLPAPAPEIVYVVSRVTAAAVSREDVYFPWDEVRDDSGRIIGCRALGHFCSGQAAEAGRLGECPTRA